MSQMSRTSGTPLKSPILTNGRGSPFLIDMISHFLADHHLLGITIGIATFLIIGIFHPVVVKCEYYFGVKCWWWFLVLGIAGCATAVFIDDVLWSSLAGVTAFSSFWTIKEIFEQRERVRKGWFPANPRRSN